MRALIFICGLIVIVGVIFFLAGRQSGVDQNVQSSTNSEKIGGDNSNPKEPRENRPPDSVGTESGRPGPADSASDSNNKKAPDPDWLVDGKRPERLAGLSPNPKPFNKEEYLANPQKYLQSIDPKRIYQFLDAGPNVPVLRLDGEDFHEMIQGESVFLRVIAEPKMPVTFLSPRFGEFKNRLRTITVAADEQGLASTKFTATSGTHGIVDITAASPTSSGEVSFRLRVVLPNKTSSKK